ncbi:MAG: type II toxin-antitoxin system HicB family antitoxin [Rhodoplanes sp.]
MIYPAKVQADSNATKLVTFPDFPEAATFGEGVEEALLQAQDALLTAIAARIDDGEDVPLPSPIGDDLRPVELPAMAEATVLLWRTMREANVVKGELARRLDWQPPEVDRLLDPDHPSRLDQIEAAFRALGKRLAVAVN